MEQVIIFKCRGHKEDSIENVLEEINDWLKENSKKVIQRNVTTDSDGWPIFYIFYKVEKDGKAEKDVKAEKDDEIGPDDIQRNVTTDIDDWPIFYIFYKSGVEKDGKAEKDGKVEKDDEIGPDNIDWHQ